MSLTFERIEKIMHHYGLNKTTFSKVVGFNNNVTLGRIINYKKDPSLRTLNKIKDAFPDLSPEWLLTGKGDMLRPVEGSVSQELGDYQVVSVKCAACEEREKVIQGLEARLTDKDKQIEDLKMNMERVISEKEERIKMKDEIIDLYKKQIEEINRKPVTKSIKKSA